MSEQSLGSRIRRGFAWSALSNSTLRLGSLMTGIVLARILAPEDFGVYAIALTVQSILINLSELGLAADLVRHGDLRRRGPTITSIALLASGFITLLMVATAGPVARLMGSEDATFVIQVMALTLPLAGIGAVPYASLQRRFMQKQLFAIDFAGFVVTTGLTVVLALGGLGPLSLAVGRVVAQVVVTGLQFALSREPLRLGWQTDVAVSGLRFGFPLALAGLLAWTLLNIDNVVVGHFAGATALGFYVLAFNVSSWPSSILGTAIRAVAFPAFAQRAQESGREDGRALVLSTGLVWAAVLLVSVSLLVMARPVVQILYGERWLPSAAVLAGLSLFGAFRVLYDLWIAYLTACGAAAALLWSQVAWILALVPAMYLGLRYYGIAGAAWSHTLVAILFMLPLYLLAIRRHHVDVRPVLRTLVRGLLTVAPAAVAAWLVVGAVERPFVQLLAGGVVMLALYALPALPGARKGLQALRDLAAPNSEPAVAPSEGATTT